MCPKSRTWMYNLKPTFWLSANINTMINIGTQNHSESIPDARRCAYFIGKNIFNNALTGLLRGLFNNDFLHHLSVYLKIQVHTN